MSAKIEIDVIVNTPAAAAKLQNVQKEIAKTATAANKLDSTIGTSISNGANKAGQSIFNLTEKLRGLQSSVFTEKDRGKIAAYNKEIVETQEEITTLSTVGTSSFGNLGAGAGKAFSALRTVANILPGIGIAGLLEFAAGPIIEYVTSLFTASEAVRKLAAENKKFSESLNKVQEAGTSTGLQLQSFVAIARDQTQSIETRNEALKSANKILGEHGQQLTLVNIATKGVTEEINKFTQATIQAALANKYSDRAADLLIQQKDAAKAYGKELSKLNELKKKVQSTTSLTGEERVTADFGRTAEQTKKVVLLADAYKGITKELNNVSAGLQEAQLQAAKLFGELGTKTKPDGTEGFLDKNEVETIASTLEKLRLKLAEINQEQALLGINADDYKKKISAVLSTATTLVTKFKVDPKSTLISKLLIGDGSSSLSGIESVATTRIKESIRRIRIGLKNELIAAPIDIPIGTSESNFKDYTDAVKAGLILRLKALKIPFNPLDNAEGLQKQLDDAQARLEKFRQDVTDILQNTFQNAAVAVGEVIGKALGGGGISSLFDGLFTAIGSGLKSLGTYLIKTYLLIELLEKIKFKNPALGVAVGVALVALGSLITARINKSAAFADGGYVSGRGGPRSDSIPAMLSNGEFVIKAATVSKLGLGFLNQLNNGGAVGTVAGIEAGLGVVQQVYVTGRIQGKDILLSSDRAQASKNRNT